MERHFPKTLNCEYRCFVSGPHLLVLLVFIRAILIFLSQFGLFFFLPLSQFVQLLYTCLMLQNNPCFLCDFNSERPVFLHCEL